VAKEPAAVFVGYARRAQPASESVAQVVQAHVAQPGLKAGFLPAVGVHRADAPAFEREHPQRMQPALRLHRSTRVHGEEGHALQMREQLRKEPILLVPCDRICESRRFGEHRGQRWDRFEPRAAVLVAVGASRAFEDRAHQLQAAVDRVRRDT
jgi:hypothetical protein